MKSRAQPSRILVRWNLRCAFGKIPYAVTAERVRFLNTFRPFGLLLLRAALALIFFAHGYPKLAHTNPAMQDMFVQHGLPAQFVYVAGVLETFGGLLLLLGLFTRAAALLLAIEMCVAIAKVHSAHGIMALHEYEFPLALAAACFALTTTGGSAASLDRLLYGDARRTRGAKN
jgi:putative oxidoreductase